MNILTKQHLIDVVCDRWLKQYYQLGAWKYGKDKEDIYYKLVMLGDSKTEDDIARVIGNRGWTLLVCDECNNEVDTVVQFGKESYSFHICQTCSIKATMEFLKEND